MSTATGETAKMAYKSDQGRLARLLAFWSLAALVFYGCLSLRSTLSSAFGGKLAQPFFHGMEQIPVLGLKLNAALVITTIVLAASHTRDTFDSGQCRRLPTLSFWTIANAH